MPQSLCGEFLPSTRRSEPFLPKVMARLLVLVSMFSLKPNNLERFPRLPISNTNGELHGMESQIMILPLTAVLAILE